MKKYIKIISIFSLCFCTFNIVLAQAPSDAYRNIKYGNYGTARAQGLSGAVGALGADATSAGINPAGAALFQKNTLTLGFDLGKWNTSTIGTNGTVDGGKFLGNFNHASYFFKGSIFNLANGNYLTFNGGISYEKDMNYARDYGLMSKDMPGGLTDLMAFRAINRGVRAGDYLRTDKYDPFVNPVDPIVALGMNGGFIVETPYNDLNSVDFISNLYETVDGKPQFLLPMYSDLNVSEKGRRSTTDIIFSAGLNDKYFFGASLKVGNSDYTRYSIYREDFDNSSYIEYGNMLYTSGNSLGLNLGTMFAVGDYGRLGISYLTLQYAQYNEIYAATTRMLNTDLDTDKQLVEFDTGDYRSSYAMYYPDKLTVSALMFIGKYGFLTYDYQYRNLGQAKLYAPKSTNQLYESQFIKEDYGSEHTHKIGIELRPINCLAVRAGYSFTGNPMKVSELKNDALETDLDYIVPASGMITDFVIPNSYQIYSAGLGFNITKRLTMDMAYIHTMRKQSVYPFSAYHFTNNNVPYLLTVRGGNMKETRDSFVTSFVFRF